VNTPSFNLRLIALALLGVLPLLGGLNRVAVVCTGADGQTHLDVAHASGGCIDHERVEQQADQGCSGHHDHSHEHPASEDQVPEDQAPDPCDDSAIAFEITPVPAQDDVELSAVDLPLFSFEWVAPVALDLDAPRVVICPRLLGPPGPEPCLLKTSRFLI